MTQSRRQFLGTLLALALAPQVNGHPGDLEKVVETEAIKVFKGYEDPVYQKHDATILKVTKDLNAHFTSFPGYKALDPNLIKSMVIQETGSAAHREAFLHDPLQIANQGDYGLQTLQQADIYHRLGHADLSADFRKFTLTPRHNGKWEYSGQNIMTAEQSILGGALFLAYKQFKYDAKGKAASSRGWDQAVARYNGGGNSQYAKQVFGRLST